MCEVLNYAAGKDKTAKEMLLNFYDRRIKELSTANKDQSEWLSNAEYRARWIKHYEKRIVAMQSFIYD